MELETLWDAIKDSVADSFVARHDAPSIFAGHYDPYFPLDLCVKDLGLIEELAPDRRRATPDRFGPQVLASRHALWTRCRRNVRREAN